MTLLDSAQRAVPPWRSLDAEAAESGFERLPQQEIDVCLMCEHCAAHCDNCGEWNARRHGRPRKEIDDALFMEMLRLRRCNEEMCAALGISRRTLQRKKKQIRMEL